MPVAFRSTPLWRWRRAARHIQCQGNSQVRARPKFASLVPSGSIQLRATVRGRQGYRPKSAGVGWRYWLASGNPVLAHPPGEMWECDAPVRNVGMPLLLPFIGKIAAVVDLRQCRAQFSEWKYSFAI